MAVPELHFFSGNDVNGATILEVPVTEDYVERLVVRPALRELGYMAFRFSRQVGFAIFDSGAFVPETFVRLLIPDVSATRYLWGCFLNDRVQQLVARVKAGENFDFGGPGPKHYLSRAILWDEQFSGTGYNIDLANGVFRWKETATAGRVLNRLIAEDSANTIAEFLPDLTNSFGDSTDSAGNAWTNDIAGSDEFELRIGDNYLTDLFKIEDSGDLETTMYLGTVANPVLRLDAWESYGRDLSGAIGASTVHFKEAVNILGDLSVAGSSQRKASHALVEGLEDAYGRAVRTTWDPGEYAKAVGISHDTTKNENVLERYGLAWLRRQANGENEILVPHYPGFSQAAGLYFPGPGAEAPGGSATSGHYWIGDTVSLTTGGDAGGTWTPLDYRSEDQRVMAITMEMRSVVKDGTPTEAALSWNVIAELNVERGSDTQPTPSAGASGGMGCNCPALCHPTVEGEPDTVLFFYNANDVGGDALNWDGADQNQGGSGDGANGTDYYIFKNALPDAYQDTWGGVSVGDQISVSGYIGCDSNGILQLAFLDSSVSTDGGAVAPSNVLATHDLTVAQPNHSHAPEWSQFSAGPFTAPSGTVSAALTRTEGVSFDELTISLLGTPAQNPYAGTDARASRCDHVHPASDIVVIPTGTIQSENVQDALEEIANDAAAALEDALSGGIVNDHGDLTGLADNDHPQYQLVHSGGQETISVVAASGSTETLDLTNGNVHDVTLTANCTLTLTGATAGVACSMAVLLRQDASGSRTVTWPASVEWVGGVAPTLQTAANTWDWVALVTLDGGTTWFAQHGGTGALTEDDIMDIGHWEVVVSGTAPPVAVTNEAEDDWVYGWVSG
jgi:hypothetical protein